MKTTILRLVIAVVVGVLCFAVFLFFYQQRMIYLPRPYPADFRNDLSSNLMPLTFATAQGEQKSYYVAPSATCRQLWILCGGNASNALGWLPYIEHFPDPSVGFLLIEYPGYGECAGTPSRESILANCQGALAAWRQRLGAQAADARLNILGYSLGAAMALQFAVTIDVDRIVLIAPFTSLRDMAKRQVGWPWHWLLRQNFDNRARIAELFQRAQPPAFSMIHGSSDSTVSVEMSRALAKQFPQIAYSEFAGEDHEDIVQHMAEAIRSAMTSK